MHCQTVAPMEEDLVCVYVMDGAGSLPASAVCNGCVGAAHGKSPGLSEGAGTSPGSAAARYTAAQLRSALNADGLQASSRTQGAAPCKLPAF